MEIDNKEFIKKLLANEIEGEEHQLALREADPEFRILFETLYLEAELDQERRLDRLAPGLTSRSKPSPQASESTGEDEPIAQKIPSQQEIASFLLEDSPIAPEMQGIGAKLQQAMFREDQTTLDDFSRHEIAGYMEGHPTPRLQKALARNPRLKQQLDSFKHPEKALAIARNQAPSLARLIAERFSIPETARPAPGQQLSPTQLIAEYSQAKLRLAMVGMNADKLNADRVEFQELQASTPAVYSLIAGNQRYRLMLEFVDHYFHVGAYNQQDEFAAEFTGVEQQDQSYPAHQGVCNIPLTRDLDLEQLRFCFTISGSTARFALQELSNES